MMNTSAQRPLVVLDGGAAGPYIMLPLTQVENVRAILDSHDVSYWVDTWAVSLDENPYMTVINISAKFDVDSIQRMIDAANEAE